ncbi:hypothetical protein WICPIJ_008774 [Wickerhamomyces pijperi]|uniref:Uncharacterized protein n=1 Tax=Wickerhamomyces pijperi TaxID=599730 RepID=A0A9P8PWJ8_WICPI|nr:hypothetical protein WICPIJ_008774 [Wickerhamomyces pijperi]
MSQRTAVILLKSLQTSSRCLIQQSTSATGTTTTKRTFALLTGSQFQNTRLFNKESSNISLSSSNINGSSISSESLEQELNNITDSHNAASTDAYHVPKVRQTVYSAQGDEIETAGPVNKLC